MRSKRSAPALRILGAWLVAVAIVMGPPAPASAGQQPKSLGSVADPVRLVPSRSEPIAVGGLNSYYGEIRLTAAPDGLVIVNRLSLERYLLGLQEVPPSWPAQALKAQAVAARTYALYTLAEGPAGAAAVYGFDICASVECQVYSGAGALATPDGAAWAMAVTATAGEAVLFRGEPILARYHSTSGGRTFANQDVFETEPGYPYLQPVSSTTERGSPLYRWRVVFPLRRLDRILRTAGWTGESFGRLELVRTIASDAGIEPDVILKGTRGRDRRPVDDLRAVLRTIAPRMFPEDYPSRWPTVSGFLPETLPSGRVVIATRGRRVVVAGRGWGHGVGMSQWGAHGLALRGRSYEEILEHYYTGTAVGRTADPGPIDVGLGWARPSATVTGSFSIVDGRGRTIVAEALGTWAFGFDGNGVVTVDPPRGWGLPLRISVVQAPNAVLPGQDVPLRVALSRPAYLRVVESSSGDEGAPRLAAAGKRIVDWTAPREPGTYELRVEASTATNARRSETIRVTVEAPRDDVAMDSSPNLGVLAAIVVALLAAGILAGRIKR